MKRRSFLAGFGALAVGGAGLTGTGAFTSVSTERSISVTVTNEASAYLAIEPGSGQSGFVRTPSSDGEIVLDFNGQGNGSGIGVGVDSTYTFDGVTQVSNQGTQTVYLKAPVAEASSDDNSTGELNDAYFYVSNADQTPLDGDESGFDGTGEGEAWLKLPVGIPAQLGVYFDTHGSSKTAQGSLEELAVEIKAQAATPSGTVVDDTGSTV